MFYFSKEFAGGNAAGRDWSGMEYPAAEITVDNEPVFLRLRNFLQIELVGRMIRKETAENGVDFSDDNVRHAFQTEWGIKYSRKFGEIFHRMIIANPHFLDDIKAIPDTEIELIEDQLYGESLESMSTQNE